MQNIKPKSLTEIVQHINRYKGNETATTTNVSTSEYRDQDKTLLNDELRNELAALNSPKDRIFHERIPRIKLPNRKYTNDRDHTNVIEEKRVSSCDIISPKNYEFTLPTLTRETTFYLHRCQNTSTKQRKSKQKVRTGRKSKETKVPTPRQFDQVNKTEQSSKTVYNHKKASYDVRLASTALTDGVMAASDDKPGNNRIDVNGNSAFVHTLNKRPNVHF